MACQDLSILDVQSSPFIGINYHTHCKIKIETVVERRRKNKKNVFFHYLVKNELFVRCNRMQIHKCNLFVFNVKEEWKTKNKNKNVYVNCIFVHAIEKKESITYRFGCCCAPSNRNSFGSTFEKHLKIQPLHVIPCHAMPCRTLCSRPLYYVLLRARQASPFQNSIKTKLNFSYTHI